MTTRPALTRRAVGLFPWPSAADTAPLTVRLVAQYAAQNPGLEFGNYCSGYRDADGRRAYFSEARRITRDLHRVAHAVDLAVCAGVTDADMIEAARRAFSGRLTLAPIDGGGYRLEYCTGQYWPTEYRAACAAVLTAAARIAAERNTRQA